MLNLISDPWIPVRRKDGTRAVIAPWQMADTALDSPDWPRPDLNIACLELLIGLVFLADPPAEVEDWQDRRSPDPDRLRARLAPFAPAFELMGDGPRFLQDMERLEDREGAEVASAGRLFIDSGGENTFKLNSDLFVKRGRYGTLDPALAAMALFTAQAYAYADSAKHKSSLRDNGPMVTLVDPLESGQHAGLWSLLWANVPYGKPADPTSKALPWLRPTKTSGKGGRSVHWPGHHVPETFFSMPWRLRLIAEEGVVTGFVRKDFGTDYQSWLHPLTPYWRDKPQDTFKARKAPRGQFFYNNWRGVVVSAANRSDGNRRLAEALIFWRERSKRRAEVIVAGWAMDKAKAADFVFSRAPLIDLPDDRAEKLDGMVEAARIYAAELRACLSKVFHEKHSRNESLLNGMLDAFFAETQALFEARIADLSDANADIEDVARAWLKDLKFVATRMFNDVAIPALSFARIVPATLQVNGKSRELQGAGQIVAAEKRLRNAFSGYDNGVAAWRALGLPVPEQRKRRVT